MLGIADKLGGLGASAGTGLGGFLGSALGMAGDVLSAPRRGVMSLLGMPDSGAEALSNWTGMDKEGLPAQGLGFLLEAALDPLTYAGGLIGRLGGRAAGALAGSKLEAQALARGPRFEGGMEKLGDITKIVKDRNLKGTPGFEIGRAIMRNPDPARILEEIPPGSKMFPASNNALAFKTPQGDVVRIGTETRANIPELIQPSRSVRVGDINVERVPYASGVGDRAMRPAAESLGDAIASRGLKPIDLHHHNVGVYKGQPTLIDPGTIVPTPGMPVGSQIAPASKGGLGNRLLDMMDADSLVQQHLAEQATPSQLDRLHRYVRADRGAVTKPIQAQAEARLTKFTPQRIKTNPLTMAASTPADEEAMMNALGRTPQTAAPMSPQNFVPQMGGQSERLAAEGLARNADRTLPEVFHTRQSYPAMQQSITGGLDPGIEAILRRIHDRPTLRLPDTFQG